MGGGRRARGVLLATVLVVVAGCGATGSGPPRCAPPPAADVGTVPGWVGYLAAHRDDVAFVVDDGRGTRLEHRADAVQPLASASKALVIVAYARAVALGAVSPTEPVRVGDWERWSVTGSETAHAQALDSLHIPREGTHARDPDRTVTLDQLADQISIWSDNAAPDHLRARLGDQALLDTARAVGWNDVELPDEAGFLVSFFTPELVPPAADRAARRAAEWSLARRYATDPAFRADVDSRPVPAGADEPRFDDGGPGGTARQLEALWSAIGHGTVPGADRARAITEQGPSRLPGVIGVGVKGGSMAGVLTRGTELRREDGTVATAVLLVHHMDPQDTGRVTASSQAFDDVLTASVEDPGTTAALRCLV